MSSIRQHITPQYFSATNVLRGKNERKRIVAYVESYDDIFFWRMILNNFEDSTRYFEVMLPTRSNLSRGKKSAIMALLATDERIEDGTTAGRRMTEVSLLACVDADYDYLMQGTSFQSIDMLSTPCVIHTHAYAIENLQCYAPSLHDVCVMATLNDRRNFDFEDFLTQYSKIIFPLFVWNIMMYRRREYGRFTITDFNNVVTIKHTRLEFIPEALNKLRHKVIAKVKELQRKIPGLKEEYLATRDSLIQLGVTPETTYLYVQGHHLFDTIVVPTMQTVCEDLRREREAEIRNKAKHIVQMQNELSAYQSAIGDITIMLKKSQGYIHAPLYNKILQDLDALLNKHN